MANVTYAPGIDHVSGALAKPKKKDGHSCGSYLLATHREAATQNPNCSRLYIKPKDNYKRSTPLSEDEMAARVRFVAVSAAVRTRAKDLQHITSDQQAFIAQKDQPYGRKTLKAYLWKVCGEAYDAQQG